MGWMERLFHAMGKAWMVVLVVAVVMSLAHGFCRHVAGMIHPAPVVANDYAPVLAREIDRYGEASGPQGP